MPQAILIQIAISIALSLVMMGLKMLLAPKPSRQSTTPQDPGTRLTSRQPVAPRRVIYGQARVGGTIVYMHATDNNAALRLVIVFTGHEVEEIGDIYFNEELVALEPDGGPPVGAKYHGYTYIEKRTGTAGQSAFGELVNEPGTGWTADHRLAGCACLYVRLVWSQEKFPQGIPNITAVIKGRKVYDPRSALTAWSANAALCIADYLTNTEFGLGCDYASEIDEDALIAAANICDEDVTTRSGAVENRYECNGSFTVERKPVDVLDQLTGAMAGHLAFSGGVWKIVAGAWRAPTLSFDEADLRAPLKIQTLLSRRDNFNAVKGTYISADNFWQPTDFPAVTSATYEAEDGGERVYQDVTLDFTTSTATAQRIARIHLRRARQPLTIQTRLALRAWAAVVGDVVSITNERMGWVDKAFEIQDMAMSFADGGESGIGALEVDVTLRETVATIYDWTASDETTADPAPNTTLPNVFEPLPAGNFTVGEEIYVARNGGGAKARALLAWAASPDAFVQSGGYYLPEYKLESASDWIALPRTTALAATVEDIAAGTYNFRLTSYNVAGVASAAVTVNRGIAALSAAPTEPQNLSLSAIGGLAVLEWDPATELDVREGGIFAVRHSPAMSGATWATATSIGRSIDGKQHGTVLPLVPGTYLVKTRDVAGIWSDTFAAAVTQQAGLLTFASLASLSEDPDFAGNKTNCAVISSTLRLTGAGLISDVPDIGDLPSLSYLEGAVHATGSYAFASGIDLGSVTSVRLTGLLESLVFNAIDVISTWPSIAGRARIGGDVTGNEADARLWMRKTDDDPAGSPTWTAWQRLDSAEHVARAFQFRLDLESGDSNYGISVSSLTVAVEEVV